MSVSECECKWVCMASVTASFWDTCNEFDCFGMKKLHWIAHCFIITNQKKHTKNIIKSPQFSNRFLPKMILWIKHHAQSTHILCTQKYKIHLPFLDTSSSTKFSKFCRSDGNFLISLSLKPNLRKRCNRKKFCRNRKKTKQRERKKISLFSYLLCLFDWLIFVYYLERWNDKLYGPFNISISS